MARIDPPYSVVLANGRVIDPETKLDAVQNIGIKDGKIAAVSTVAIKGQVVIDASASSLPPIHRLARAWSEHTR